MAKKILKEILSWILVFVIAFAVATFVNRVIILKVKVPTGSMENSIMVGDRVVTLRLSYLFNDPKRGDIVVFPFPDNEEEDYIKRIIGLPGETIEGKQDKEGENIQVYVDGVPLEEPYIKEILEYPFGPFEIPEDSYFMMGDNRNWSEDSRYWENPYVSGDKIKGKAIFKYPNFTWFD